MFPLDEQDMEIVAPEGWARLERVLFVAIDLLGPVADATLPKGVAAKILAILKPAEALARRLLYLLAPTITLTPKSASPAKAGVSSSSVPAAPKLRDHTPVFRLTEPATRAPKPTGPRLRYLDGPPAPTRPAKPICAPQTGTKLRDRLIALSMVLGDPDHHAKRLARFLARRAAKAAPRPVPLNFENVPGLSRKRLDADLREALEFTNAAAQYKAAAPPG
ncbi:MAG: hypothetical protein KJ871_08785 [Alphaproteobacteria bacterium]|nr:hypothetical protein [Alphaproteobacteria bacterium]MBU2083365.1 hypothetical protein [Alphaproteobacteria bacterium]MBU2143670.1 hypothetical protein [Alphaproteobacteria bacterium]MBU2195649.1 hypothetical protein [Alphaproteobacteria bacterium]